MKIAVVIPTYKRIEKLKRCLKSLDNQTYKDFGVFIYCDNNDKETFDYFREGEYNIVAKYLLDKQESVIGAWNRFTANTVVVFEPDAIAWIVDDVELYPNCLEKAIDCMQSHFPDLDGVCGIRQECPGHSEYTYKPFGQVLLGKKFVERYPNKQVCCPFYKHFYQDEEMWLYACSLGKFKMSKATLKHYHPAFVKAEMDSTHPIVRGSVMRQDTATYNERKKRGLIWGQTFKSVEEYDAETNN